MACFSVIVPPEYSVQVDIMHYGESVILHGSPRDKYRESWFPA